MMLTDSSSPSEDVNVSAVVAGVVVVCLLVIICGCGGFLLHRNGFFSRKFFYPSAHQSALIPSKKVDIDSASLARLSRLIHQQDTEEGKSSMIALTLMWTNKLIT